MVKKNARIISGEGIGLIKDFEKLVLHSYLDPVKIPTIGYGTTHYETGKAVTMKDAPITKARAEQLLKYEIQAKADVLNRNLDKYNVNLNQNQYDAISSFIYNVGIGAFVGSTLFRKMKLNPNDPTIKNEFMRWDKSHTPDGKVVTLEGLKKRRALEAELYFK